VLPLTEDVSGGGGGGGGGEGDEKITCHIDHYQRLVSLITFYSKREYATC
jgi:hypothetical protein